MIGFKDVSAGYRRARVLEGLNFHIDKGEFVFLTGPSGSGKSTLLKLIYHELKPLTGEVTVAEYSSNRLSRRKVPYLRRKLGVVFQDFALLDNRTAGENVAYALEVTGASRTFIRRRVSRVLEQLGLAGKEKCFPNELSGGEQQRVAIARALVGEPFILIADEPTGNLDSRSGHEIMELLHNLHAQGVTIVMVTHDHRIAEFTQRVIHLDDGHISQIINNGHKVH